MWLGTDCQTERYALSTPLNTFFSLYCLLLSPERENNGGGCELMMSKECFIAISTLTIPPERENNGSECVEMVGADCCVKNMLPVNSPGYISFAILP